MLGAMVVHLQRQLRTRVDADTLDLEATTHIDRVVPAPGAVDGAVVLRFGTVHGVELVHQLLDVLDLILVSDHGRVFGLDNNDVIQADYGYQLAVTVNQAVAAVFDDHVASGHVTVFVFFQHIPKR